MTNTNRTKSRRCKQSKDKRIDGDKKRRLKKLSIVYLVYRCEFLLIAIARSKVYK